jgi:hypothetical protein
MPSAKSQELVSISLLTVVAIATAASDRRRPTCGRSQRTAAATADAAITISSK